MKIEIWNEGKIKYRRDSIDGTVIEALKAPNYTVLQDGKKLSLSDVSGSGNVLCLRHKEVDVFYNPQYDRYEFKVPKGEYVNNSLSGCINKIEWLIAFGEKVSIA